MSVYAPNILSVTITPNPANISTSFTIAVEAEDSIVTMYTVSRISGTSKSGQSTNLTISVEEAT